MIRSLLPLLTILGLVSFFAFGLAPVSETDRPLTISVRPRIAFAPADVSILIRLHPAESDRNLRVWTDGAQYSRSSAWTLEGEKSPKLFTVQWWKIYPGDEYDITASVSDSMGVIRASATERLLLTSP